MDAERRRWIEAGARLAVDPTARVPCPSCGAASLDVRDEPLGGDHFGRWIACPACGRREELYLRRDA